MTSIVWSAKSIRDLEAIEGYVAQFNPIAARRLVQKIVKRTRRLERFPLSGGFIDEDDKKRYRQVLQGNYRVIYRHDQAAESVYILAVTHAARLLDPDDLDPES